MSGATLFAFGYGFSARETARRGGFARVVGTVRTAEKACALEAEGVEARVFDGTSADPRIADDLAQADAVLISIPPRGGDDPALAAFGEAIAESPRVSAIVYLSTLGVYGDHGGAWVDETTPPRPDNPRTRARLAAEEDWAALGTRAGKRAASLRLGGIYGPGRNAIEQLRAGTARRIVKPGQVFNRIHVADIAQAALAAIEKSQTGAVYNVCDDEPCPPQDVIAHAATLIGMEPPPEIPFEEAQMSELAREFYAANRRVSNARLEGELGVRLLYPTYREGLAACLAEEGGRRGGES